jgi:hypothetical protein
MFQLFPPGNQSHSSIEHVEIMSTSSSSSTTNTLGQSISEKLSRDNYIIWKARILEVVGGAQLDGHLNGTISAPSKTVQVEQADKTMKTEVNSTYTNWYAQDH